MENLTEEESNAYHIFLTVSRMGCICAIFFFLLHSACFGSTYTKIGMIQRRLAWPLCKDDMQFREAFLIFENTRELLTPGYINRQELIKHLHTYTETKHCPRANKFQRKTYHANSPATQEHSPELQYTGCPKLLQTQ